MPWSHRGPELDGTGFALRKLRKRLARTTEVKRLCLLENGRESEAYQTLCLKLGLDRPTVAELVTQLNRLQEEVTAKASQEKRDKIRAWRHRMCTDVKALGRWLKSKLEDDQGVSETLCDGAQKVHRYWSTFWRNQEATKPADAVILHRLTQGRAPRPDAGFSEPSVDELVKVARKQKGSAGPDGWSGAYPTIAKKC